MSGQAPLNWPPVNEQHGVSDGGCGCNLGQRLGAAQERGDRDSGALGCKEGGIGPNLDPPPDRCVQEAPARAADIRFISSIQAVSVSSIDMACRRLPVFRCSVTISRINAGSNKPDAESA